MDSKKVLQKLLKIAENQQKIIMKLAQDSGLAQPLATGGGPENILQQKLRTAKLPFTSVKAEGWGSATPTISIDGGDASQKGRYSGIVVDHCLMADTPCRPNIVLNGTQITTAGRTV